MVDYIIVGAGSAGCVLANRLSASGKHQVLLLEAGQPDKDPRIQIPAAFPKLFKTELDWDYETVPQPGANDRRLYWPRGKTLGGSSSTNAMIYIRGNRRDYDDWAAAGCAGWSFRDVLPYFKKSERNARGASEYHGGEGPLAVSDHVVEHPLSRVFVEACEQAGIPAKDDFNSAEQDGAGIFQVTQDHGQRCSAARAFLKPALRRSNLAVETGAQVTRLILEDGRAAGVVYVQNGTETEVRASKEVILSGGSINSPQILLLSGIGPADHLAEVGIECRHALPGVGANLHDHPVCGLITACTSNITLDTCETAWNFIRYTLFKSGPFTSNLAEAGAFVRTDVTYDRPDIQFHFGPLFFHKHGLTDEEHIAYSLGPCLIHPESRGTLRLKSADPFDAPLLDPQYLTAEKDMQSLLAGVKLARTIAGQHAFDPYRGEEIYPGTDVQDDAALDHYIRDECETLYHPVGTCKMGTDDTAVVDPELRVRGLDGLRVVDASIMPTVVGGNTNAPTIMIAEKAADLILASAAAAAAEPAGATA